MTCERSNRAHQKFRLMRRKVKAPAMNRFENFFKIKLLDRPGQVANLGLLGFRLYCPSHAGL